jgi:competence protein ComEA
VPDLLRPEPPRSFGDRLRSLRGVIAHLSLWRVAFGAGLAGLGVVAAWWLLHAPAPAVEGTLPRATRVSAAAPAGATRPAAPSASATGTTAPTTTVDSSAVVVVQIAGAVVHPGVYRLAAGARVIDLLDVAGGAGPQADPQALSLAARLVDGERVYVPKVGEPTSAAPAGPAAPTTAPAPVDLNAATVDQLDTLPGVGPATAAAIVAQRQRHGRFHSVDDLADVPGIGPAKLDALRPLVRV